ncbi:MAG TPA: TetR family transcriptional regulator C-terminal domain-containing protein [Actinomycetes bacterium]|nr:TetR family transcriptional regulator C-terminal domain-containing protein [Actinomycetes bacterium]
MAKTGAVKTSRGEQVLQRRAELLAAAKQVVLERGLSHTRVADVADATNVSGGLIHYHFATKDILLTEMLRTEAERDIEKARRLAGGPGSAVERLDRVMREFVPARNDQTWVLWIDAWGAGLRDESLRHISEELDEAWRQMVEMVIVDGVAAGEFACPDPEGAADRISAMLDGLGLRVTLRRPGITRKTMIEHARISAEKELGLPTGTLTNTNGQ